MKEGMRKKKRERETHERGREATAQLTVLETPPEFEKHARKRLKERKSER